MRPGLCLVAALTLFLAGCTGSAPVPPSPNPVTPTMSSSAPVRTAVTVPGHLAGEISREVYTGTTYDGRAGRIPASMKQLDLLLACAGPTGSQMRWEIRDANDRQYTAGTTTCDGQQQRNSDRGKTFPTSAALRIDVDPQVVNGWAVLTGS